MNSWPFYSESEIEAASNVLRSGRVNYWTGQEGRLFEKEFASFCKVKYAVAVTNGTVALELALRVLNIGQGDEVIVPARTYIATASTVVNCGAHPIFADVDINSQNITLDTILPVVSARTKAIIVVHLAGWPCDMDPILAFAAEKGIKVIEDCAQAHGARYKGRPVGSFGDVAAFSFCQDKIISTGGEGGMVVTNTRRYWKQAWSYKDHGKSYEAVYQTPHPIGFRWLHDSIGSNWRMTEMQAAIGRIALCKLTHWNSLRNRNARYLIKRLQKLPALRLAKTPDNIRHGYYKFDVFIRPQELAHGWNRDRIMAEINARGIFCSSGSCPEVYLEKAFEALELTPFKRLKNAKLLGEVTLTFLVHPQLKKNDINEIACAVEAVISSATIKRLPRVENSPKELINWPVNVQLQGTEHTRGELNL